MHAAKQKVKDAAAVAKEHAEISEAKFQEKAEKGAARTKEEKEIVHERRKAKEAEAKMKMHEARAQNAQDKLHGKHFGVYGHQAQQHLRGNIQGHQQPLGAAVPPAAVVTPTYPLAGHPPPPCWTPPK